MATKTITLTGAEVAVTGLDGANAHIRNDGTDVIYAAKAAGISAGADGVLSIPAGQAATVYGISGTVYMLGAGSAQIISNDYSELPFKTSATSGGSGADEVARAAINAHSGNADIHVTAEDKAKWNAVNYSNPNLLINPNFKINQRGLTEYAGIVYSADRWKLDARTKATIVSDGIKIESIVDSPDDWWSLFQPLENISGSVFTVSVYVSEISTSNDGYFFIPSINSGSATTKLKLGLNHYTYNGISSIPTQHNKPGFGIAMNGTTAGDFIKTKWMKVEVGSIPTPFCPPDPASELAKCQRYYQIRSTGDIPVVDLRPSMRTTPTVTQLADGNYAYSDEL